MPRRATLALLVVLLALPASAGEREVTGDELALLLTGNSIDGMWSNGHYVQFFDANGRTVYVADGRQPDWGTWRIGPEGRYCSVWRDGGESCYAVVEEDGDYFWLDSGGNRQAFTPVEGNVTLP